MLRSSGLVIVSDTGKKISELIKKKKVNEKNENSIVYKIPCSGCDRGYFGETYRGLTNRLREQRADVRYHRQTSALVQHIDEVGHLPKWERAEIMENNLYKQQRKVVEALYIENNENINQRTGDIKWTTTAAALAARERRERAGSNSSDPG